MTANADDNTGPESKAVGNESISWSTDGGPHPGTLSTAQIKQRMAAMFGPETADRSERASRSPGPAWQRRRGQSKLSNPGSANGHDSV